MDSGRARSTLRRWPGSSRRRAGRRASRCWCWSTRARWSMGRPRHSRPCAPAHGAVLPGALTLVLCASRSPVALTAGHGDDRRPSVRSPGRPRARLGGRRAGHRAERQPPRCRESTHGRRGDRGPRGPRRARPGRRADARRPGLDGAGLHTETRCSSSGGRGRFDAGGSRALTSWTGRRLRLGWPETLIAQTKTGGLLVPAPVDYAAWTERVARFAARPDLAARDRQIWLTGRLSPRARQELARLKWATRESIAAGVVRPGGPEALEDTPSNPAP